MKVIGVTGSVASGKSTAAKYLADLSGWTLWNADQEVHRLYKTPEIKEKLDSLLGKDTDREHLRAWALSDLKNLLQLENLIHSLLSEVLGIFLVESRRQIKQAVILEVPLLYEVGWDHICDTSIVISVDPLFQKQLLQERGLTSEETRVILDRQWSSMRKCQQADWVIENQGPLEVLHQHIKELYRPLCEKLSLIPKRQA